MYFGKKKKVNGSLVQDPWEGLLGLKEKGADTKGGRGGEGIGASILRSN